MENWKKRKKCNNIIVIYSDNIYVLDITAYTKYSVNTALYNIGQ